MKKAFVTGADGFLGINLVSELVREQWNVIAFHLPSDDTKELEGLGVELAEGDILDYASLLSAMPEDSGLIVFHVAGDTSMWHKHAERQHAVNVIGTRNVARAAMERGVSRMVFTSSISAYGFHNGRIDEQTVSNALLCRMNYNKTKYLAEQEIRNAIANGLNAVIVNPCNMLGSYDRHGWSALILNAAKGRLKFVGSGTGTFAHVKDVARAHIKAAEQGITGENYLLGGIEISFLEIGTEIYRLIGKRGKPVALPSFFLRAAAGCVELFSFFMNKEPALTYPRYKRLTGRIRCNDEKARRELGFSTVPIREMLADSYRWLLAGSLLPHGKGLDEQLRFVEVEDEPLHREQCKTGGIRVYRAIIPPGEASMFHRHSKNTVYIVTQGGRIMTIPLKGHSAGRVLPLTRLSLKRKLLLAVGKLSGKPVRLDTGFSFFMPAGGNGVVHAVRASADNQRPVEIMGVELACESE